MVQDERMQASHGTDRAGARRGSSGTQLRPLRPTPPSFCNYRLPQTTKKPGRWRNGHSSMHPQTRPPRLRRNDITWSSSSCVRGRGAACIALPPKASPHTTPPRQSKASQQFVSLRLRAVQSWAPKGPYSAIGMTPKQGCGPSTHTRLR